MITWIRDQKENLVPIAKITGILLLGLFIFKSLPLIFNKAIESKFDASCIGIVDSVQIREGIIDSHMGGKVIPQYYKVFYSYRAINKAFQQEYLFNIRTLSNTSTLNVRTLQKNDSITIQYNVENPLNSKPKL